MAGARFFAASRIWHAFMLCCSVTFVLGRMIPDNQVQHILHELIELTEKIDGIENNVNDLHEHEFGESKNEALISGKRYHVPDGALTASSSIDSRHGTQCSRLGVPKPSTCASYAWRAAGEDSNQWLQVDLGRTFEIQAVATQGRGLGDKWDEWMKTYKMASRHGSKYLYYIDRSHGGPKIFHGNYDRTTVIKNALVPPIRARFVRICPMTWQQAGCVRWELYGKPV